MFENVSADLRRACDGNQHEQGIGPLIREVFFNPGTQAVLTYRLGHWIGKLRFAPLRFLGKVLFLPIQYFFSSRVGIYVPLKAEIGPGFLIHTWGGGIFLPEAPIGVDFTIVGGGVQMDYMVREIGDRVSIAPGTKVVGKIRIGHDVRTAPNAVVQRDVPDGCVVFGNPARIIGPIPKATSDRRVVPGERVSKGPAEATSTTES